MAKAGEDNRRLISERYSDMLSEAIQRVLSEHRDLTKTRIGEESGLGRTGVWRLETHQPTTTRAAERLVKYLVKKDPDLELPPPAAAVENRRHFNWIELGRQLLDADPAYFDQVLEAVAARLEARLKDRESLEKLREREARERSRGGR